MSSIYNKVGIFTEGDYHAIAVISQASGDKKNILKDIISCDESSYDKIEEIVSFYRKTYKIYSNHFYINMVDDCLIEQLNNYRVELQVKDVDETKAITTIKSFLRDDRLLFDNELIQKHISHKLKNEFEETETKCILKSVYLACQNIKLSTAMAWREIYRRDRRSRQ